MDIRTLESFKLSDAVKFHDKLNPKLWRGSRLDPAIKLQLKAIANDFMSELGIKNLNVADITVSGSNAAYTYTPHSDLDLHILVDMTKLPNNEVYRELFNAKKTIYNDSHDIKIKGIPVELYVQDSNEPVVSLGEYSLLNDKWLKLPTKRRANLDQTAAKAKYEKLYDIIQTALQTKDSSKIDKTLKKIKQYRKAGLDRSGEFGPENLAFKAVRSQGLLDKLYTLRDKLHSEKLSIEGMYSQNEDYHPNAKPRGPEFKPTMPAGTVRVDVSDVYDWYKLGQHISNLKGLGHHDFGQGPPSTIMSFGSEPEEHKYIKDLEKTGLSTTDIDPIDVNQPKGMKRQKVDPTYNVNEKINPSIIEKDFKAEKTIDVKDVGPLKLEAYNLTTEYPQQIKVDVITPDGKKIGYFRFVVHDYEPEPKFKMFSMFKTKPDPYLVAGNVSVWNEYQKKGIATEVYKWIKSMGNDIKPSPYQSDAGKAMWRGFEKEKTIAEEKAIVLTNLPKFFKKGDELEKIVPERSNVTYALHPDKYESTFYSLTNKDLKKLKYYRPKEIDIPKGTLVGDMAIANQFYRAKTDLDKMLYAKLYKESLKPYPVDVSNYKMPELLIPKNSSVEENTEQSKQGSKSAIYSTDVYGMTAYHSKCLEPGCDWESKRYDSIKLAQNAAQKHAQKHFKQGVAEGIEPDYMAGHCHVMALALKKLHPDWKIRAHIGWDEDAEDDNDYRIDHVYIVAPDGSAYDCRGKFDDEKELVGPDETGGVETQFVDYGFDDIKNDVNRGELKKFTKDDIVKAINFAKRLNEGASGYIPSNAEKNDPRFKTALTVDIKPDTMKKNAKAFGNKISRAGIPPTLKANGLY